MITNMKPKDENELKEENKGLQRDLLEMVDEDFESFEDTAATNNLNQSQGKLNEPSVEYAKIGLVLSSAETIINPLFSPLLKT